MFGYVIPVKCELKVRELEQFQGAYCGLCHSLKRAYGPLARFVLNFDFTFLAILLSNGTGESICEKRRCAARPFRKQSCTEGGEPFQRAAAYSIILTKWRLMDAVADKGFVKGLPYRLAALLLGRAYRRAAKDFPAFDAHCQTQLATLRDLERAESGDLDRVADAFAQILPHATEGVEDAAKRRTLSELLYHTGRWIYLIDAYDDLEEDRRGAHYNPLATRFACKDGALSEKDKAWLETTLNHSANLIASAYNLLPHDQWSGILENIIYLGFPRVTESVLKGRFRRRWGRWERKEQTIQ